MEKLPGMNKSDSGRARPFAKAQVLPPKVGAPRTGILTCRSSWQLGKRRSLPPLPLRSQLPQPARVPSLQWAGCLSIWVFQRPQINSGPWQKLGFAARCSSLITPESQ